MTNFLKGTKRPLILLAPEPTIDAIAAAYAIAQAYKENDAQPAIACSSKISSKIDFLEVPVEIMQELIGIQDFILQFDTRHNAVKNIAVEYTEDNVSVVVTPQKDFIDPRDFSFAPSRLHYDSIVLVGLENIADVKMCNDDINTLLATLPEIRYKVTNKNPVLSEQIYNDISLYKKGNLSQHVAQYILTGIVAATDGLRNTNISSKLFSTSATLMRQGADLQTIMMALYKKVSLQFIRIWGSFLDDLVLSESENVAISDISDMSPNVEIMVHSLEKTAQFLPGTDVICGIMSKSKEEKRIICFSQNRITREYIKSTFKKSHNIARDTVSIKTTKTKEEILAKIEKITISAKE